MLSFLRSLCGPAHRCHSLIVLSGLGKVCTQTDSCIPTSKAGSRLSSAFASSHWKPNPAVHQMLSQMQTSAGRLHEDIHDLLRVAMKQNGWVKLGEMLDHHHTLLHNPNPWLCLSYTGHTMLHQLHKSYNALHGLNLGWGGMLSPALWFWLWRLTQPLWLWHGSCSSCPKESQLTISSLNSSRASA